MNQNGKLKGHGSCAESINSDIDIDIDWLSFNQLEEAETAIRHSQGKELLSIFCNSSSFLQVCQAGVNEPQGMKLFLWRLQYTLGEIILQIQNHLISEQYLQQAILLDQRSIHELTSNIIQKGRKNEQDDDFRSLRSQLEKIYNKRETDEEMMLTIYGNCMKLWKKPYDLDLSLALKKQEAKKVEAKPEKEILNEYESIYTKKVEVNPNPNPRYGPYSVMRMPASTAKAWGPPTIILNPSLPSSKVEETSTQKFPLKASTTSNESQRATQKPSFRSEVVKPSLPIYSHRPKTQSWKSFGTSQISIEPYRKKMIPTPRTFKSSRTSEPIGDEETINLKEKDGPPKCFNRNWSLEYEAIFCRKYIECETSSMIQQYFQRAYGSDARWSSSKQIDSKMQALVAKVFKKFGSLETVNENFIKFRGLKTLIISSDQLSPSVRKSIFRLIAAIYEAIMDMREPKKKDIISQKVRQILTTCEPYEKKI